MTKIKIEIKNRWTGKVLFEYEKDENTMKDTVMAAVEARADLRGADLRGADLRGADLTDAVLTDAVLTPIKDDFFAVLIRSLPEIGFLRKNIVEGNINGSTYDGDCACLSGTLANGAKKHNGPQMDIVVKNIMSCRNASRPIERFFLNIAKGDTPETNQFSKLAMEWLDEFMFYIDSFRPEAEQKAKQKA